MSARSLPFTLYPRKTKSLLLLMLSAAFAAGGVLMILRGEKSGWLCAAFFGLGIPVFLLKLLYPRSFFLTVNAEGIEIGSLFRTNTIAWSEISDFGVFSATRFGTAKMVGLNFSAVYKKAQRGRAVAKALSGFDGALPDTFGFSAKALAQLLSECHQEWILKTIAEHRDSGTAR